MALAVLPLALSAIGGYVLLRHGVLADFQDVASRQRNQIEPTQRLRLLLWDTLVPLDDFVDEGHPDQPPAYRAIRQRVEAGFAELQRGLKSDPEPRALVERAREEWTVADGLATDVLSTHRTPGDPHVAELMDTFHGRIATAVDRLGAVSDDLGADLRADHDEALLSVERSEWLVGVAAGVSCLMILVGVLTIGRMMAASVDRLVVGAGRFAAGDRDHRINIEIPPELRRVADEFNRMIVRIHKAEEALASLARRDGLTGLLNRRAFDDALAEGIARSERLGESVALLMIDIDHFKRINDTYGHLTGDEVLCAIAQGMARDVRLFDRVFRIGGEEFAVLLFGAEVSDARSTAERLREAAAAKPMLIQGKEVTVTVSIGVAMATPGSNSNALVGAADAALYQAKNQGRNRVVLDGSDHSPAPESHSSSIIKAVETASSRG